MKDTIIYVVNHKLSIKTFCPNYETILVGSEKKPFFPILTDNTKDNIAYKNRYYCELTALYWIWKNSQAKTVGLTHYHRYFYKSAKIKEEEIQEILKEKDVILPVATQLDKSVYLQYASVHYINDLDLALQEIEKQHKNYQTAIQSVLESTQLYSYNMFISSKQFMDDYCSFLFPILFRLEEKIPYQTYFTYNQRVFGFLAERIFNIYLKKQNVQIFEYPVIDTLSKKEQILKRERILKEIQKEKK